MLNAFLVALAVFICVGGAELIGFTMLNRPIVIGPLVGLFLGDLHTGVIIGASLEAVFMGVVNIGGASAAEPGIATAVGTAFAIMLGKGSEVALTLAFQIITGAIVTSVSLVGLFEALPSYTQWYECLSVNGTAKLLTLRLDASSLAIASILGGISICLKQQDA